MTSKFMDCPECSHDHAETVDTKIKHRGAMETYAIRECQLCGTLWGEPRDFAGIQGDGDD